MESKKQRDNLKSGRRKVTNHMQDVLNKISSIFLSRNPTGQKAMDDFIHTQTHGKNPVN